MNILNRKLNQRSEGGFSLIDVVVTVAIIVALSVGGFVSYNGLVQSAKQGAVGYAAYNVYKSAVVYESDSTASTNACSAVDEYNSTSAGIGVELMVPDTSKPGGFAVYYGKGEAGNTYSC